MGELPSECEAEGVATQKTSAEADVFAWCIIFYSFPHCLPVKNRRVVVARNTLPARSTVEGNSG